MRKKILFLLIYFCFSTSLIFSQGYQNPILKGFNPDPSICRVGDDFYMVTSSFEYFPGLPIYHSKDLINWEQIEHCLTRDSQLSLQNAYSSGGLFAPSLRYHDGTFYVICTNVTDKGNFYCTTSDPSGEWSDPIWVDIKSIDPDIFWDDDNRTYFVTQGNEGIRITEFDIKTGKILSPERLVWGGIGGRFPEAPHVYKKDGYYYLLLGEGGTEYAHSITIGRSKNLYGPYEGCPLNPILTHCNRLGQSNPIQGVGHGDLIQASDGSWWAVFLGFRVTQPYSYYHILGRETFLAPVDWPKGGWPQINGNGTISLDMKDVPTLPQHPVEKPKVRTDFNEDKFGFQWQFMRNPIRENYSLKDRAGFLTIKSSPSTINENKPSSFVARRQTEHDFRVETRMIVEAFGDKDEAGLTLFQNNSHHYDLLVSKKGEAYILQLKVTVGSLCYIATETEIERNTIILKIDGSPLQYTFRYSEDNGKTYKELDKLDTRYLSTEVAGGFTGVMIGMYITSNGIQSNSKACFDWFDYETFAEK